MYHNRIENMLPLRCFTCNNFIGDKWDKYTKGKNGSHKYKDLLDSLGLKRICCRRMLLGHVEVIDDTIMYSSTCTTMDESNTVFNAFVKSSRSVNCN